MQNSGQNPYSQRRTRRHLHKKLTNLFIGEIHVNRHIKDSLAVSNAVELFKLIFLNTSTAPEVPNLLAESLRRYSEHDLFAAFSYLREKKIMVRKENLGSFSFFFAEKWFFFFLYHICLTR